MPFNPGVYNQSGSILAQGINQAGRSIGGMITTLAQQNEDNKQLTAENKALEVLTKSSASKVGVPPELVDQLVSSNPDESPRDRNARLKTALSGVMQQEQMQEQQQRMALTQAQIADLARREQADQRNQAAARTAVAPVANPNFAAQGGYVLQNGMTPPATVAPTQDEIVRRYLGAGGDDPAQVRMLVGAARPTQARQLQTVTLRDENGNPVSFAWDGSSAPQRITPKVTTGTAPLSPAGKLLADADTLEKQGDKTNAALLRKIASKQGQDKPMSLTDYLISGGQAGDYQQYVRQFEAAQTAADGTPAASGTAAAVAATGMPVLVSTPADFNKLPSGARFRLPDGRIGTKK